MEGRPAIFRLLDVDTALIVSNSVVYSRTVGNDAPAVQYQNHSLNRWIFRRRGGNWRIAENVRRPIGSGGAAALLKGV